jgi:xanthine dehydrogenase accessory factor
VVSTPSRPGDLLAQEVALAGARRPYAGAVVTRVTPPTSCAPGDRALVTEDGTLTGWVGGSCTAPVVVREALASLADGRARLLRLGRDVGDPDPAGGADRDDIVRVPLTCASEGEVEVLVEPHLPPPHVVAVGSAPVLDAFVDMASRIGYDAARVDGVEELEQAGPGPHSHVVVATFGRFDEDAVASALAAGVPHVSLVASRKRAATVLATLRQAGVPEEDLGRVQAPAGLDLGAVRHLELAVALLGGVVADRVEHGGHHVVPGPREADGAEEGAAGAGAADAGTGPPLPEPLHDPVCGMTVTTRDAVAVLTHDGVTYGFCSAGCRTRFATDPSAYVPVRTPGWPTSR